MAHGEFPTEADILAAAVAESSVEADSPPDDGVAENDLAPDSVGAFKQLARFYRKTYGKLSPEQNVAYGQQVQDGLKLSPGLDVQKFDPASPEAQTIRDALRAREILVGTNMAWITTYVMRYVGRGLPHEDLLMEGIVGTMRATQSYDPAKGYTFTTYATWWMCQRIQRALADTARTIRVPKHIEEILPEIKRRLEEDPDASIEKVCADSKIAVNPELVKDALASRRITSLHALLRGGRASGSDTASTLEDVLPNSGDVYADLDDRLAGDMREVLWTGICRVIRAVYDEARAARYERVLGLRLLRGMALREVGAAMDPPISAEGVRKIEAQAMEPLRKLSRTILYELGLFDDMPVPLERHETRRRGGRLKAASSAAEPE